MRAGRIATLVILGAMAAGCGGHPVVGVLVPRTGTAATYGESVESGIRVAIAQARERGAMPSGFEVLWEDTASDPGTAVAALRKAVEEGGARLVIGGVTSDEARALLPALEELGVICLSPSASAPGLARESKLFYRIFPSDELEGRRAGRFLFEELKKRSVLVVAGESEYVRGIEPEFVAQYRDNLGGTIVGRVALAEPGWEERLAEALEARPEAVYIIAYTDEIVAAIEQLRKLGYEGAVCTTSAFYSGTAIQEGGEALEGVFFPLPPFDPTSEDPLVHDFVNRYTDTYQRAPDVFAAHGYDAMRIALEVARQARPFETAEISKALHFSEFKGVTGPIRFDDYGEVKHYPKMFLVHDGKVVSYDRYLKEQRRRIINDLRDLFGAGK